MGRYFVGFFIGAMLLQGVSFADEGASVTRYLQATEFEDAGEYAKAADIVKEMLKAEPSVHLFIKLAELQMSAGKIDEAIDTLKTAEKSFPKDPDFKFFLAQLYEFNKKNLPTALQYYSEAVKLSSNTKYEVSRIRVLESLGDYKEALEAMDKVIAKDPSSQNYSDRGRIYHKKGSTDKAIADLKKAVEIDNNMSALLRLADIYLSSGANKEAKAVLEQIAKLGNNLILPELKLGEIYQSEKDYGKAIELYSKVADKLEGKDRAAVLKQMGSIQYEIGDYDNASRTFEWVTELAPEDSMSAYLSGTMYEYIGNFAKAKEVYEKAIKLHPKYAQLLKRAAVIYIMDDEADTALKTLENIDSIERDVDYYLLMGEAYSKKGDTSKAIIALIAGLNDNPTDTNILYLLAFQYDKAGERDKAVASAKKALSVEPANPMFQNFLGYIYADMGINLDEAKKLIEAALEKDPLNPAYLDSMAWVCFKMKDYSAAHKWMQKALEIAPDEPELQEHMRQIKQKSGK